MSTRQHQVLRSLRRNGSARPGRDPMGSPVSTASSASWPPRVIHGAGRHRRTYVRARTARDPDRVQRRGREPGVAAISGNDLQSECQAPERAYLGRRLAKVSKPSAVLGKREQAKGAVKGPRSTGSDTRCRVSPTEHAPRWCQRSHSARDLENEPLYTRPQIPARVVTGRLGNAPWGSVPCITG